MARLRALLFLPGGGVRSVAGSAMLAQRGFSGAIDNKEAFIEWGCFIREYPLLFLANGTDIAINPLDSYMQRTEKTQ